MYCDLISKAALDGIAQSQSETADSASIEKVKKSKKEKSSPKAEEAPVEEAPKAEEAPKEKE